ncbi:MAG: hypothetical protein JXA14_26775 [Anaerolineae bacterium]|nr:hypothetical protein [Anaerolineae bacterium]
MRRTVVLFATVAFGGALAFLLAAALPAWADPVGVTLLPPVTETDGRAGACYSFYHEGSERPYVQMAYDAGSRWDRFDFDWSRIEPTNGVWSDTVRSGYDTLVNDLDTAGINMVGILLWTPDWATTSPDADLDGRAFDQRPFGWYTPVPRAPSAADALSGAAISASSPPQGLYEEWNDWTAADGDPINYWGRFVHAVVSRYGDRVKHWEVWNEPEWNYFWTGTSTDYTQLLKVGYQATKAACPDCTVLFGGLHYWWKPNYYRWVLNQINADPAASANNYFFDVMSVHLYSRSSSIYNEINNIRSGMSTYNVGDHPIWLTETGVPVWNDGSVDPDPSEYDYAATQDEAAAYVIQSYANAWAAGVERYFFFRTHDSDMSEYFGLIRNDKSLRPSYTAYQVAVTYLVTPTFVTRASEGPFKRVTLWDTPRGRVDVLWNDSLTTTVYALPAAVGSATLVDRWGITSVVAPIAGVHTLTLAGATANLVSNPGDTIIGGDPLIVIQAETLNEPPTSAVNLLPDLVYSTTFTVTWEGWDSESSVWAYDVQVRDGEGGEWEDWLHMTPSTSALFSGEDDHTYYFRCRAVDGVGHRESWPEQPRAHTTVDLPKPLYFSVTTFFADDDQNGIFSPTGEITLTQVTLRLLDESGQDVISPTVSNAFTATVEAEQHYALWIESGDYVRALSFSWPRGGDVYAETYSELGLWPAKRVYVPLALKWLEQ